MVVTKRPWLAEYVGRKLAWQSHRPSLVVVCTAVENYDVAPIRKHLPESKVELIVALPSHVLGMLRNEAMQAASERADVNAIMCTIDDDDLYGTTYLEGIVDAWSRHPEALVVGRASFESKLVTTTPSQPPPVRAGLPSGRVAGVAGATISIPVQVWRNRPELRYPPITIGEDIALLGIAFREGGIIGASFGDFMALRYSDEKHGHVSPEPSAAAAPPVLTQQTQAAGERLIRAGSARR